MYGLLCAYRVGDTFSRKDQFISGYFTNAVKLYKTLTKKTNSLQNKPNG